MSEALEGIDAPALRRWFEHALRSLVSVREEVDVLNLFPVPDSDTGTNMVLTLAGAAAAARDAGPDAGLGALAAAAARGALYGARGNSGIILSQAIRAVAEEVRGRSHLDAAGLTDVLGALARGARAAVADPVEGTILTTADAAAAAARALPPGAPLGDVVATATAAALATLGRPHESAPTLDGEGVDAGAAAFVVLLASLALVVGGEDPGPAARARLARATLGARAEAAAGRGPHLGASRNGHHGVVGGGDLEVMYVLTAGADDAAGLRERLRAVGTSVAVVGGENGPGEGLWHVHVHTDDPLGALAVPGTMEQICVRALAGTVDGAGVVACTRAPGLVEPLARAGAAVVLHPDAAGIARAVVDTGAREVLVLPCDAESAAVAAAAGAGQERAALALARPRVRVVATRNELDVLAAVAERVVGQAAGEQAAGLEDRCAAARTLAVDLGDAEAAVSRLVRPGDDVVTVVLGAAALAAPAVVERVRAAVAAAAPDAEVVVLDGGQVRPDVLLGAQ
ncbi:DAK2 domain-containing protein [Georgenia faecalis]|uniref:DAK2 domain-containing protein n=1 Tax=Georgenia faecalis TaxID=2483799 RepID=A0ABV9DAB9_9MICO|nr:DAK2 domain-containing protein [Georgenia faecalis]